MYKIANEKKTKIPGKFRILALSGGGAKGAYQAGAIKGLVERLGFEAEYDLVTGVSVGSINMAVMASFPIGKECEAAESLESLWKCIEGSKDIYKQRSWINNILLSAL